MKKWLFIIIFILASPVYADDIIHATSEDISEFDSLIADEPLEPPPEGDKKRIKDKDGDKGKKKKGPRYQFRGDLGERPGGKPGAKKGPKGPPKDDRERGRRNPPPPKNGPGGGGPPPPPPPG